MSIFMLAGALEAHTSWRSVALLLACSACAAEEVSDGPVRPSQYGGASGAGAGTLGTGGVSGGGSGGALGSAGSGGAAGTFGGSGAAGASGGAGTSGASGSAGSAGSSGGGGTGGSGGSAGSLGSGGTSGSAGSSGSSGAGGGSGTPGAQLFFDDFEVNADKWQALPADGWSVVVDGTKVYQQGTLDTQGRFAAAGNAAWKDQVVEAKVKVLAFTGSSSSYQAAVYARFTPDAHYYVALQSNGDFKIKKFSGGNNTSISSAASVDVAVNTWYTVKLEVIGTALKAYLNGTAVLNATDADVTAGGVAVGTKNATAAFDDVRVTAP